MKRRWISFAASPSSIQCESLKGVHVMKKPTTLGALIKQYRTAHKMGMSEFGKRCGLSKAYISILENNERPDTKKPPAPSLDVILAVATAMEKDANEVLAQLGLNIKDRSREIEGELLGPLSTNRPAATGDLQPWQYIPLTVDNLKAAVAEQRLLILPFRAPKMGDMVFVPLKQFDDMPVAHTIVDCRGGIYTAHSEAGGPITFSLFDIDRVVFMSRSAAVAAKERWRSGQK